MWRCRPWYLAFILTGMVVAGLAQETLVITPGDLLHIQVADTPEMERHARVTDLGRVPIVGIGEVDVAGLTPHAAAAAIRDALIARRYLNHPDVSITVDDFATKQVSIIGEVKQSGVYAITTKRPILDVLALAGGLTPEADRHILIERQGKREDSVTYYVSNDAKAAVESQVQISPGDTIVVPRAGIVYILGDVNKPGGYVMTNNDSQLTLLQVVALAGGTRNSAKQNSARLIRRQSGGGFSDTQLRVGDIQKGKRPDVALLAGDIVYIPSSFGRDFIKGAATTIASAAVYASIYAIP